MIEVFIFRNVFLKEKYTGKKINSFTSNTLFEFLEMEK